MICLLLPGPILNGHRLLKDAHKEFPLWVKNPTATAQVTAEARDRSLAWHGGLKDPVWLQLRPGFNPLPENSHMLCHTKFKKRNAHKREAAWVSLHTGPASAPSLLRHPRAQLPPSRPCCSCCSPVPRKGESGGWYSLQP